MITINKPYNRPFLPFQEAIKNETYVFLECDKFPSCIYLWNSNGTLVEFSSSICAMTESQMQPYLGYKYRKINQPEIIINFK